MPQNKNFAGVKGGASGSRPQDEIVTPYDTKKPLGKVADGRYREAFGKTLESTGDRDAAWRAAKAAGESPDVPARRRKRTQRTPDLMAGKKLSN